RRIGVRRDAVESRMAGQRSAAVRARGRTRLSVICEQTHFEAVRRRVCTGFLGIGMEVVRMETLPGMPHGEIHLCFSIEYAPEQRKLLIELAGEIARDPLVLRACFGLASEQDLRPAA
ncbi:MAG: hypothetical protein ABN482_14060, partial [Corticimicrobacter sp.]|uniref:hypothetical protein n=1 Tax=Corticimicrobacter sp. TaxID=2678536 RepID=UPI0032DB8DC8